MYNRNKLFLIITSILVFIGISYAYFEGVVHGTGNTNAEGSAHTATIEDLILTGTTEVVNTNMVPGEASTYSFTIVNPNSFQVCFGIYFDNVTNTFVNTSDLEVSMGDEVGTFPTAGDTSTIISGFRAPANSTTLFTITITYKDVQGKDQTGDMGAVISGLIKARTTECGPEPSDITLAVLEGLNDDYVPSNSDKCLHVDSNGMITDYNATMADNEDPIICAMEDDYGTSYYLRGLHTDNNVKFANMCWKIVRVTGTGGIKLIYNGDVDGNGTCTTSSGTHNGYGRQLYTLYDGSVYGTGYTKEGSTYTLTSAEAINYTTDSNRIIGKYTCFRSNSSCSTLYYVTGMYSSNQAEAIILDQSTNYAQIGASSFNYYYTAYNRTERASLAYSGYMYNDVYPNIKRQMSTPGATLSSTNQGTGTSYVYGDTLSYSNGRYKISNQNGTSPSSVYWGSDYTTRIMSKYTCMSSATSCEVAYQPYTADVSHTNSYYYMTSRVFSGGALSLDIKLAASYRENNGVYELIDPETISISDWITNGSISGYNNYYVCKNWNLTTCSDLRKITGIRRTSFGTAYEVSNNFYYGSSFTYNENSERPYTLTNTVQFLDFSDSTNKTSLNTHHYTCFYGTDNTCDELYFIYYLDDTTLYYIKLDGNETIDDALDKMLRGDNINVKDSVIKTVIDWWYEQNFLGTANESKLEDTVFCNDRTIDNIGGWSETGNINDSAYKVLKFNAYNNKYYLKCPNRSDAFTVSDTTNGNGALDYPIGLFSTSELLLAGNNNVEKTNANYWHITPYHFDYENESIRSSNTNGSWGNSKYANEGAGIRPSISLKYGTTFDVGGDGTASNPFVVSTS